MQVKVRVLRLEELKEILAFSAGKYVSIMFFLMNNTWSKVKEDC
jgi:hypothetical protein